MGASGREPRKLPQLVRVGGTLAAAWAAWWWALPHRGLADLFERLYLALLHPPLDSMNGWSIDLMLISENALRATLFPFLIGASVAVGLGGLARNVARARRRAGCSDPLEAVRAWTREHTAATRALVWMPAATWLASATAFVLHPYPRDFGGWSSVAAFLCLGVPCAIAMAAAARGALRALLLPTLDAGEATDIATASDRLHFDAIAVTAETRAAVAVVAVLPVLTVLAIGAARLGDAGTIAALACYAAVALGSVLAFRRASRIAVGVDGVFVTGSSRTRFLAYKDIDGVAERKGDLVLERRGEVVLRLQLHGRDAECRDALLARLKDAVRLAHEGAGTAAAEVVSSVSSADLARAAAGASDYRSPAVTRDQLWGMVEGTEHDAAARTAAARALVSTHGAEGDQTARLRVAAERCAEPRLRVALLELADDAEESDDAIEAVPIARYAR
jgi:hypothetical protein